MKYHEPRFISLVNAGFVTAAYIALYILSGLLLSRGNLLSLPSILFLVCSASFLYILAAFVFSFSLKQFIYSKIRLVYKSIHSTKAQKGQITPPETSRKMLEDIEKEVEGWQMEKNRELEHLKQLEQYRREFIGNVSHELKTPLTNIQGYVLTLLDGGLEDPVVNREYLKRTEKSVDRLIRIVEDLDEISQLESGQMQLKVTRFDLVELTREVVEFLDVKARECQVEMIISRQEKPLIVEADKEKIRQVLINIIHNSIRYKAGDSGRTKIAFFDMDENILTEITDNGIGIDRDDLPRVFERFYRTLRGRTASKTGKGLGLAIVKHIIEAHDQTINVRSTVGVGTTFGFTLKKAG
jgi:two-component system, OmpR family, phosphate regulon sensor histidine kinase PhoR